MSSVEDWPRPPEHSGATNWADVRRHNPALVDRLAVNMYRSDDAADRAAADLLAMPGGWRLLDHVLSDVHKNWAEAPESLQQLLAPLIDPPSWYAPEVVDSGARAWWRFGSVQAITLYQSLLYGYQSPGLSRPLALTGRLTSGTSDRLAETGRWIVSATSPGGMAPGARGWAASVRIRMVHALVRRHLLTAEGWDQQSWGVPINQSYSALTISGGFLVLPLVVAADLGISYSSAELEAIAHQWRWIGFVMGVADELLPHNYREAQEMFDIAGRLEIDSDSNSHTLTDALLREGYSFDALPGPAARILKAIATPVLASFFASVSTRWVPPNAAKGLGLRRTPAHHLVVLARQVVRLREATRTLGILGPEDRLADRELRFVVASLGRFSTKQTPLSPEAAA